MNEKQEQQIRGFAAPALLSVEKQGLEEENGNCAIFTCNLQKSDSGFYPVIIS